MDSSPTSTESAISVSKIQLYAEVTLVNGTQSCAHALTHQADQSTGLVLKKPFALPQNAVERCIIHGRGSQYSIELTHRCAARAALYEELVALLQYLVRDAGSFWFRTSNKESNPASNCLFDGIKLELNVQSSQSQQDYGICFSRTAFVEKRESFYTQHASLPTEYPMQEGGTPEGQQLKWTLRGPTDTERLRVNRGGQEVLYFCQPPNHQQTVTITELRSVICRTLDISDETRVVLNAGPFFWDVDFEENGRDLQTTYFLYDTIVEGRHMKTARGSALIYVLEVPRVITQPS